MLVRVSRLVVRRRRAVLVAAAVTFAVAGAFGGDVATVLSSGGFDDPSSESFQADQALLSTFGTGVPNIILVVTVPEAAPAATGAPAAVDGSQAAAAGQALTARLAAEGDVTDVVSYWSLGNAPPLRSSDGTRALVLGRITGEEDHVDERIAEIAPAFDGEAGGLDVQVTGFAQVFSEVNETIEEDLLRAELISLPITLLLLLLVFRGVVAAALPLVIGVLSIVSTFLALRLINELTDVSVFALNLTTGMGLGLAIDYSLFVVSRYREEIAAGHDHHAAVARTVRTAGRTVAFSAGTVAASLLALLIFPIAFLRSFAYAGVAVAALAGFFSVVVLPAMLAALGPRVDAWSVRRRAPTPVDEGFWHRMALVVMRRPLPIAGAVVLLLLLLGSPFLRIDFGLPDDRVLPEEAPARAAADVIRDEFDSEEAGAASVVLEGIGDPADPAVAARTDAYAKALSQVEGATRVDGPTGTYVDGRQVVPGNGFYAARFARPDALFLSVVPEVEPISADGEAFARAVRAVPVPHPGAEVAVTGQSATLVDSKAALVGRLPLAALIMATITFALLFLMFGSVVIPLKALVLNVLSLSATFGSMVWIFQDGNLSGLLGFTPTGSIAATSPILMFCVAFGLSMDYEVFLLSRIKEEHDAGADDVTAVAVGLEKTGRIVTAAALLISVVFLAFGTSRVAFIQLFGIGLALAVLIDAFLIRGTLVPAFMRLAGAANWWAPGPMRRFHERFGVSEHVDLDGPATLAPIPQDLVVEQVPGAGRADPPPARPRRRAPLVAPGREL